MILLKWCLYVLHARSWSQAMTWFNFFLCVWLFHSVYFAVKGWKWPPLGWLRRARPKILEISRFSFSGGWLFVLLPQMYVLFTYMLIVRWARRALIRRGFVYSVIMSECESLSLLFRSTFIFLTCEVVICQHVWFKWIHVWLWTWDTH